MGRNVFEEKMPPTICHACPGSNTANLHIRESDEEHRTRFGSCENWIELRL